MSHYAGMLRVYHAARAFALGYFFGLGVFAMTHYITVWPETYDRAAELAFLPGGGALLAWLVREFGQRRSSAA